jgi:hypothetical protein
MDGLSAFIFDRCIHFEVGILPARYHTVPIGLESCTILQRGPFRLFCDLTIFASAILNSYSFPPRISSGMRVNRACLLHVDVGGTKNNRSPLNKHGCDCIGMRGSFSFFIVLS